MQVLAALVSSALGLQTQQIIDSDMKGIGRHLDHTHRPQKIEKHVALCLMTKLDVLTP